MSHPISAIIAGATGLVGNELLHLLLGSETIGNVYALSRSALPYRSKHLIQLVHPELRITEWDDQDPVPQLGLICLGTTLKSAGSKDGLRAVDIDLVKSVARSMRQLGVETLVVISSLGASRFSPSFYLRCKAEMEQAVAALGFPHCIIVRPGPLTGERTPPRPGEEMVLKILDTLSPLLLGPLSSLTPIAAEDVAAAMLRLGIESLNTAPEKARMIRSNALRRPPFGGAQHES
ncbi:NAD(P)H-binding protein [Photobacterium sp. 1_MG-2023]|uniref:NAD(P)H-binding protein n=1 Tax=Photobacterium sp. 1_MG-2023 TaxID=3062646 RepID=UPI0026E1B0A3|nr:NAD(P)H-binding protein [Photobacterium sp. 1_MG-2023]MDO6707117.1 NAD(P)H-binding protein [Photobacterium sp. 1_MG-2023]